MILGAIWLTYLIKLGPWLGSNCNKTWPWHAWKKKICLGGLARWNVMIQSRENGFMVLPKSRRIEGFKHFRWEKPFFHLGRCIKGQLWPILCALYSTVVSFWKRGRHLKVGTKTKEIKSINMVRQKVVIVVSMSKSDFICSFSRPIHWPLFVLGGKRGQCIGLFLQEVMATYLSELLVFFTDLPLNAKFFGIKLGIFYIIHLWMDW